MSQQPHDMGYLDYGSLPPNRSPSSSRQPFSGAPGFPSGLSLQRQPHRPFESPLGSSALFPSDRVGGGYNHRMQEGMGNTGGMPGYMLDASQTWNYGAGGGAATVNGAVNGPGRQRSVNRRAALPQNWTDHGGMGMHNNMQYGGNLNGGAPMHGSMRVDHASSHPSPTDMRSTSAEEQLIPTAIVIKNIPFAVRKEALAGHMADMSLPQPYAFNYHFDNGVFRGLAFANFQSAEDTRIVIEAMNGLDVHGRKLRVEYKKMLPEAERERIEREKRERRGQLEEQHRGPMLHQQSSIQSLGAMSQSQQRNSSSLLDNVDMNDPQNLEFYTELRIFDRDDSREILVFPPTITPDNRRAIHILAHNMGLEHQSIGDADSRQITVLKKKQPSPTSNIHQVSAGGLDPHKRGLSRAATFDFAADRDPRGQAGNFAMMGQRGPTLELPGSPDGNGIPNNLRAAKSFADLRSFTPSPSQASTGSYLLPGAGMPGSGARFGEYMGGMPQGHQSNAMGSGGKNDNMIGQMGNLNLGSYDSNSSLQSQARSTPGAIGSQRPGANGGTKAAPDRQPRVPEWSEAGSGFSGRGRTNGHMPRGSG